MWRGRAIEILELWLIVTCFVHRSPETTGLINLVTGGAVAIFGASYWNSKPWQGLPAGSVGLLLYFLAFIPALRTHQTNRWIDLVGGFLIWFYGWRIVANEKGGPWPLKDRPVY